MLSPIEENQKQKYSEVVENDDSKVNFFVGLPDEILFGIAQYLDKQRLSALSLAEKALAFRYYPY